jgi:hypothetical protein
MRTTSITALLTGLLTVAIAVPAVASSGKPADSNGRPGSSVQVTVLSSGLTYDSIVAADLPMRGRFQQLIATVDGLFTQYGPGDHGYVGGRWWIDANRDGAMDEGDAFFLCPLLGPGR